MANPINDPLNVPSSGSDSTNPNTPVIKSSTDSAYVKKIQICMKLDQEPALLVLHRLPIS